MKKPIKTHICPVIQLYADKRIAKTPALKALRERNEALRALIMKPKKVA